MYMYMPNFNGNCLSYDSQIGCLHSTLQHQEPETEMSKLRHKMWNSEARTPNWSSFDGKYQCTLCEYAF